MTRSLCALLLVGCGRPTVDGAPKLNSEMAQALDAALENARAEQDLPGLAMAVMFHEDDSLWVGATGLADVDRDWTTDDRSRIGSVTKTFTAAVIHQLIDEGSVSLDDPLAQWIAEPHWDVTVADLLSMSSGIVSYNYVGSFDTHRAWTPQQLVQWAYDHEPTLRFEPGTDWEYSNTNYVLLGMIIEAATGDSYEEAVQERLLDPLGLNSIELSGTGEDLPSDLVHCFDDAGADLSDVDPSFGWAAGSLMSTPSDLAMWNDALYFGQVLSPAALDRMVTPLGLTGPDEENYGMGAFYEGEGDEVAIGHTGGIAGYLTSAYSLQEPPVTLIVMANQLPTDLRAAQSHGWAAILGIEYP